MLKKVTDTILYGSFALALYSLLAAFIGITIKSLKPCCIAPPISLEDTTLYSIVTLSTKFSPSLINFEIASAGAPSGA